MKGPNEQYWRKYSNLFYSYRYIFGIVMHGCLVVYTLIKKENIILLIYKEIQKGAVSKSNMTNGLLMYD